MVAKHNPRQGMKREEIARCAERQDSYAWQLRLEGYSLKEIAEALGSSQGVAASRIRRYRRRHGLGVDRVPPVRIGQRYPLTKAQARARGIWNAGDVENRRHRCQRNSVLPSKHWHGYTAIQKGSEHGHWGTHLRRLTIAAVMVGLMITVMGTGAVSAQGNGQEREGHGGESFKMSDLRDTICQPIDAKLGAGACTATVIFLAPLGVCFGLWVGGVRHPMALSGGAAVGMCGAGALVFPSALMIGGFLIAAAGAGGGMLLIRR